MGRRRRKQILFILLLIGLTTALSCTVVPPRITSHPPYPLALGGIHVSNTLSEHHPAIVQALEEAGIPVTDRPRELLYMLRVDTGATKASNARCGRLRNVRYTLNYAVLPQALMQRDKMTSPIGMTWSGQTAAVGAIAIQMVARGYDGSCHPNIFDDLSAALRQQMTGEVRVVDPPSQFMVDDPRFEKLRDDWVHVDHSLDSDIYYSNRRECMDESRVINHSTGVTHYDGDQFEVCMASFGWRHE